MAGKTSQSGDDFPAISEINVTPFVDVVLVLLVIFMVTAPMLVREQMSVNLPKAKSGEKSASEALPIVIDKDGRILFQGNPVSMDQIEVMVKAAIAKNPAAQAIISADQESRHGDVVRVLDTIKQAGVTHFAIQIEKK